MIWFLLLWYLFVVVPIHEIGHYVCYRFFGFKPKIRLKIKSLTIQMGHNVYKNIELKKQLIVALAGITTGLMVAFWNHFLLLAYVVACLWDFLIVIGYLMLYLQGIDIFRYSINDLQRSKPELFAPSKPHNLFIKCKQRLKHLFSSKKSLDNSTKYVKNSLE